MKILMLTPYLPFPPASGGQIRTLNLLRYLSRKNDLTLIALYKNEKEKTYSSHLESFCKKIYLCKRPEKPWQLQNVTKSVFSFLPFLIVRNYSVEARQTVEKLLREETFDIIHAETFYIMPHIPKTEIPILLVEQTIEYQVYQHFVHSFPAFIRPFFLPDILKLKYWERHYWEKADLVAAVSDADRSIIAKTAPQIRSVIVPNGAGEEMFVHRLRPKKMSQPSILFMGNFSWLQNTEAAEYLIKKIYPLLENRLQDISLVIAGQSVKKKIKLPPNSHIRLVDVSPDDSDLVRALYSEATLFIAPIFGPGGTRLKILAAMASGLPVVATKTGIQGLNLTDKKHVLIAENPSEFVERIIRILSDEKLYNTLRANAYEQTQALYSWPSISKKLESVYKDMIKNHAHRH